MHLSSYNRCIILSALTRYGDPDEMIPDDLLEHLESGVPWAPFASLSHWQAQHLAFLD